MEKYRILVVHNYYQVPGGEDTVVQAETEMLKENGHEVYQYTRHNSEIKAKGLLGKIKLFLETIFSFKTYREVKKIIKKNRINIVHVHNTLPLISPSVYYAAFACRVPVVQTIHNFRLMCPSATFCRENKICEECLSKGLKTALKHQCYRNSYIQTLTIVLMLKIHRIIGTFNRINGYITLTEFNKKKFLELVKDQEKVFVKPNFVKGNNVNLEEEGIENYFVFLGRLDAVKGINSLINAWMKINDQDLYVIGDGPERENIQNIIDEYQLKNIRILGFVQRDRAFQTIKNCRAVIIPSQWQEPFGMVAVEAFRLGIPVIASDIGALRSIVGETNGLKFKHDDVDDLVSKINLIKSDDKLRQKLSIGALKTFKEQYTDITNYKILYNIYKNIFECSSINKL